MEKKLTYVIVISGLLQLPLLVCIFNFKVEEFKSPTRMEVHSVAPDSFEGTVSLEKGVIYGMVASAEMQSDDYGKFRRFFEIGN